MSSPYIGECRLVGFNFAPQYWLMCQGQLISIAANSALYNLIGTTYGGDGQSVFGLPDLQGRVPVHQGSGFVIGQRAGSEGVTLQTSQLPLHSHTPVGSTLNGTSNLLQNNLPAGNTTKCYVATGTAGTPMNGAMIQPQGNSLPHENRQPFLAMTWIISLDGIYPAQG